MLHPNSSGQRIAQVTEYPGAGPLAELTAFDKVPFLCRRVNRGEAVIHKGDPFCAIYAVRSGSFKCASVHEKGHQQIVGFFMRGELFGLEGIGSPAYSCTVTALEDSEIIVLPFALMQDLAQANMMMQRQLHQILSREITRDHGMMLILGSMRAEARLASFLLNLSERFARQGYSRSDFVLRMGRADIGSYLGLQIETVSRLFAKFQERGLLKVELRNVCILDPGALQELIAVQ